MDDKSIILEVTELLTKPLRKPEVICEQIEGNDFMLYDEDRQLVHIINHTAYMVWQLCDGSHTIKDIVNSISSHFNYSIKEIVNDIIQIIKTFEELQLMKNSK